MATYRVMVYAANGTGMAPGTLLQEFETPKNLGYAYYLNDIGESFFTIGQHEQKVNLRAYEGTAHVVIIRDGVVVWRGILAEHDANEDDVIFYAYGYEHVLYHIFSLWNQRWANVEVAGASGTPINDLWTLATTTLASQLSFATAGTIQAPVTETDGAIAIVLSEYKLYYKRILHAMKELVALATSDTTNICYLEIDYPTSPTALTATFNFWKDKTTDRNLIMQYPGNVQGFSDRYVPISSRNELLAVGTGARGQLFLNTQSEASGTFGYTNFGRRQESLYLSWVRDAGELERVNKLRLAKALREDVQMSVKLYPDSGILPARATGSGYAIGDRVRVKLNKGNTNIDKSMLVIGEQVLYIAGREHVQPILEDRIS